uniref:receptor protein-tyrosine kinase n=1 Tax=Acrobeloides nanus TaxID=290746 RepID=A0A914CDZ0_9BILA
MKPLNPTPSQKTNSTFLNDDYVEKPSVVTPSNTEAKNPPNNIPGTISLESIIRPGRINTIRTDEIEMMTDQPLGEGSFGRVYQGKYKNKDVAIKCFLSPINRATVEKALNEIVIMAQQGHAHVQNLIGIVMDANIRIVTELRQGSLSGFLPTNHVGMPYLLKYCQQIASGMQYLHGCGIIHGDLAARNVLVKDQDNVLVSDFGLAQICYRSNGVPMPEHFPFRYCPPECFDHPLFTRESDVWAFGVTCWEIFTHCRMKPYGRKYSGENFCNLKIDLEKGHRLKSPPLCEGYIGSPVYTKMLECWHLRSEIRPAFYELERFFRCKLVEIENED